MIAVPAIQDAPGHDARRRDAPERAVDVALRDGSTLHVRPVRERDATAMRAFFDALSVESIGLRFFGIPNVQWVTKWAVDVEQGDRYALVATTGPRQEIVAHGAYVRARSGEHAEVAFVVADAWQGQGIATIMLGQLAAAAQEAGVTVFTAEVLPHNHRMIEVFRNSGFPIELRGKGDVIEIRFPTSLSEDALVQFERREATAAAAALTSLLHPSSVAVIGASRHRGTAGAEVLHNLLADGFAGPVYPINRRARSVAGLPSFASISDVRAHIDLAVIAVAAADVADIARACGTAGVRSLIVLSSGFADSGPQGEARQRELLAICRERGMRLVGPNCLGVLNAATGARLHATFAGPMPPPGRVGVLSQSVGLGIAILELASRGGLGLSTFVSVGNKADISGNDLLQYWEQDADTAVAALYLESFGNPRRFSRIARRVSRAKPIVVVKGGRTQAGVRAARSRSGDLLSASEVTVDALFEQAGVIRADTIGELFDVASLLSMQPAPAGRRVAIICNAAGPGVLGADACQAGGLEVVELPANVRRLLASFLPATALLSNPIDMLASASGEDYRRAIEVLAGAGACDCILTIFVPPLARDAADVAAGIHAAAQSAGGVTVASVFMGCDGSVQCAEGERSVPRFGFPEDAARALAHAGRYGDWLRRPAGKVVSPEHVRPDEAAAIIVEALSTGAGWLEPAQVTALLDCYGLPLLESRIVRGVEAAVTAAGELGAPVALKGIAPGLLERSDAGAVRVGLERGAEIRRAAGEIRAAVAHSGRRLEAFMVQPMAGPGVELVVGIAHDSNFGPVLVCGLADPTAELVQDAAARITPLTDVDAREMLRSLRSFPLLAGYRGAPACDVGAIEDVLLRLSALVETHPEVAELDLNPLVATPHGAVIVDARVRLEAAPPTRPLSALRA
jgi:acyl-CoA synthetase (NDP forming)/RimJ/RimL family protein N-acetyltransferase